VLDLGLLTSWHADWRGLRVCVLGLGVTGFAASDTLAELGASVLVVAERAPAEQADLLSVIGAELLEQSPLEAAPTRLVEFDPELIVVSPGFHPDHPVLGWATEAGIPIWGDIELAWRLRDKIGEPAEWLTVTGTNGKTTTVQLAAHILATAGRRVAAVGNIGIPVLDAIRDPSGFDVLVVELSSYQLHWVPRDGAGSLSPLASACLNVADDHLDWHGDAARYRDAKATVYWNTKVACVYNRDDEVTMRMVEGAEVEDGCRAIGFGLGPPGPSDLGVVDDILLDRAFIDDRRQSALELTTHGELRAAGLDAPHLIADVLAAAALVRAAGVEADLVRQGISTFAIAAHRTQIVAVANGVEWIDDSKATNPHAAGASLRSRDSVVWIVGGQLKGVDIGDLVTEHATRIRAAIVIGTERVDVLSAFARHAPETPVFEVGTTDTKKVMPEAVRLSAAVAKHGDTVLLAPAAASFDQFADYADRGNKFASAVMDHVGGATDEPADESESPTQGS
jgi:UDP-N-acetylmuramoylalanine--D-glutamate ligase